MILLYSFPLSKEITSAASLYHYLSFAHPKVNKCQSKLIIAHCVTKRVLHTKLVVLHCAFLLLHFNWFCFIHPCPLLVRELPVLSSVIFSILFINFLSTPHADLQNFPETILLTSLPFFEVHPSICSDNFSLLLYYGSLTHSFLQWRSCHDFLLTVPVKASL